MRFSLGAGLPCGGTGPAVGVSSTCCRLASRMSRTAGGRFGQENELLRSVKEPVTYVLPSYRRLWERQWVVPSAVVQPAGAGQNMTDRLGQDAHAMRSSHPVRILKWVRTDRIAKFESPVPEEAEKSELILGSAPDSTVPASASDVPGTSSQAPEDMQTDPDA